jgi:hypothetical protein
VGHGSRKSKTHCLLNKRMDLNQGWKCFLAHSPAISIPYRYTPWEVWRDQGWRWDQFKDYNWRRPNSLLIPSEGQLVKIGVDSIYYYWHNGFFCILLRPLWPAVGFLHRYTPNLTLSQKEGHGCRKGHCSFNLLSPENIHITSHSMQLSIISYRYTDGGAPCNVR